MILIISENNDYFTDRVIEWLLFKGQKNIIRINEDDEIELVEINIITNKIILAINKTLMRIKSSISNDSKLINLFIYNNLDT